MLKCSINGLHKVDRSITLARELLCCLVEWFKYHSTRFPFHKSESYSIRQRRHDLCSPRKSPWLSFAIWLQTCYSSKLWQNCNNFFLAARECSPWKVVTLFLNNCVWSAQPAFDTMQRDNQLFYFKGFRNAEWYCLASTTDVFPFQLNFNSIDNVACVLSLTSCPFTISHSLLFFRTPANTLTFLSFVITCD